MSVLEEIEAIKKLKYKYFRCLDSKDWAGLAETLAEDASSAYDSGKYSFEGRAAIMEFLEGALGSKRAVSMHHGHHPEIELTGETTATGCWYLEDIVIFLDADLTLHGAGFYRDEYVKTAEGWRIRSTGYERTFEEMLERKGVTSMRTMFDQAEG